MRIEDVVIIGAGPAGIATAIQLRRYGLEPLLLEKYHVGGLLVNANLVENYPGRIDLQLKAANTIARLCRTKYQITSEQKAGLKEAITKVLTEVALPLGINVGMKAMK